LSFKELAVQFDKFPHIKSKLEWMWGTKECRKYLLSLKISDRPRNGFPFAILIAIDDLIELHDITYPQWRPIDTVWDNNF